MPTTVGSVDHILRFGYFLMTVTILLMVWCSYARAANREIEQIRYPPCSFNPLCSCSKPAPDLGIVQCRNVPFPSIPNSVNTSKVFMLHMERTGLRELEPYFFQATGLYRLEISYNLLTDIPDDSFIGLERSLWELILQHNELTEIPSRAMRHLQKLRHLDLSGNQITCLEPDSFRGLEGSLQTLILSRNLLNKLPPDSFSTLPLLDTIDLSGNNIAVIDTNIFRDGMPRLHKLLLADNILTEIPYIPIAPLKQLRVLDISHNLIQHIVEPVYTAPPPIIEGSASGSGELPIYKPNPRSQPQTPPQPPALQAKPPQSTVRLTLDILHLEYNQIRSLPTGSFVNFDVVNVTYLDGNPLKQIADEAFRPSKIRELYIRFCSLNFVSPLAFEGLGATLQILDLSGNNISSLAETTFHKFDVFRVFNMKGNNLKAPLLHNEMFNDFQFTLLKLDLSGDKNAPTNLQELRRLRNVRSLSVSRLSSSALSADDFLEFGLELEDLKITRGSLQSVKANAFKHVRGIKRLDLSENQISSIDVNAFHDVGHSLISLKMSHGLAGSVGSLPPDAMQHLTSLQELDVSNNRLKSIGETCFHFLKNLRVLEMNDNLLDQVAKGTFQGDIHEKLEIISLGFNEIKHIAQHTFVDLEVLQRLHLDDNRIETVERRSFMNLDKLRHLSLRGNKLVTISDEAFQIYPDDSLPQSICAECHTDVTRHWEKMGKFHTIERHWMDELKTKTPKNRWLKATKLMKEHTQQLLAHIVDIHSNDGSKFSDNSTSSESILKQILLNHHIYEVKSLQQHCIDFFNTNGPNLLDTILHVENPSPSPVPSEPESLQTQRTDDVHSVDLETADETSQAEDTRTEPDTNVKAVKKKRANPVREYIKRRKRRFKTVENARDSPVANSFAMDGDSESQDSFSFSTPTLRSTRSAPVKLELKPSRSSERLSRAPVVLDASPNLPELDSLDLAYNSLAMFDFDFFDQVGTLASLRVNASHNKIMELVDTKSSGFGGTSSTSGAGGSSRGSGERGSIYHSNIKVLDLSHNNVSRIDGGFFKPAEMSLTQLYLGYNSITNTTRDIFGNMPQLQWLDLSHNLIEEIDFDTFRNTKNLQVIRLAHNNLADIPSNLFKSVHDLRVVDISHNHLKSLPDNLFPDDGMESLDLSHNFLMKIPVTSLKNMAALTLCELDLSHNNIASIHSMDLSNKFRSLSMLDLSNNKLFRLDDAAFATLPRLSVLDLSHNEELKVMDRAFFGLHTTLIKLGLDNVSLSMVPDLPLPALRVLRLSNNELPSIPQELAPNMSQLRVLDLSDNDLTNVPILTHSLTHLRWLSLAGNSIRSLTNSSFTRLSDDLAYLDISQLDLNTFEHGALDTLKSLRSLRMSPYPNIDHFNIPSVIDNIHNLRELWIEAPVQKSNAPSDNPNEAQMGASIPKPSVSTDLGREMVGDLPLKLRAITLSGADFNRIADNIFNGIKSSSLKITLYNTSIAALSVTLFRGMGDALNISIDVHDFNPMLSKIANPNTASSPHSAAEKLFLIDFKLSGSKLNCDCGIGWIEFWQRKKRQYFCSTQSWSESTFGQSILSPHASKPLCTEIDDDLREVVCTNKKNQQLLEVLKSDLECGWDSGAPSMTDIAIKLPIILLLAMLSCIWF